MGTIKQKLIWLVSGVLATLGFIVTILIALARSKPDLVRPANKQPEADTLKEKAETLAGQADGVAKARENLDPGFDWHEENK